MKNLDLMFLCLVTAALGFVVAHYLRYKALEEKNSICN